MLTKSSSILTSILASFQYFFIAVFFSFLSHQSNGQAASTFQQTYQLEEITLLSRDLRKLEGVSINIYPVSPAGFENQPFLNFNKGELNLNSLLDPSILQVADPDEFASGFGQFNPGLDLISQLSDVDLDCIEESIKYRVSRNTLNSATVTSAVDDECFDPITSVPIGISEASAKAIVGFLVDSNPLGKDLLLCTAVRVSIQSVLTAKHCFFDKNGGFPLKYLNSMRNGWLHFYSLNDLSKRYVLSLQDQTSAFRSSPNGAIPDSQDFTVLTLDTSDIPTPKINFRTASSDKRLITVGFNSLTDESHWTESLRWSQKGVCFVSLVQDGCIVHGCNTTPGFSGAPLFQIDADDQSLSVVGLQIAAGDQAINCPTFDGSDAANSGIDLSAITNLDQLIVP
jgi:hypothetical protein